MYCGYGVGVSKPRKISQDKKQTFTSVLQNNCSEKIKKAQRKYFSNVAGAYPVTLSKQNTTGDIF